MDKESLYQDLLCHIGHNVQIVTYGESDDNPDVVSIECVDCQEVLVWAERPKSKEE